MMKKLYSAVAILFIAMVNAQHVGVGTETFSPSEVFKVVSNNRGVLLPNVNITDLNISLPILNPANSLLVYNNNINTGKGFYYWKDNKWNPIIDSSNIYKLLGITRSESAVSTSSFTDTSYNGANSYTIGELPSAMIGN